MAEEKTHKIDITPYDGTTVKIIKEMMKHALPVDADLDLEDEFYITLEFKNLDHFLHFWKLYGKYVKNVWDNSKIGPKFHNYV